MSQTFFLNDRGVQVAVTPNGDLNLKKLSGLSDDTRQEVLSFARKNRQLIIKALEDYPAPQAAALKLFTTIKVGGYERLPHKIKN